MPLILMLACGLATCLWAVFVKNFQCAVFRVAQVLS